MTKLDVFQLLATLPGHGGSFKSCENAILNDPKCQKRGFRGLAWLDRLYIANDDGNKCFRTFGNTNRQESDWVLAG